MRRRNSAIFATDVVSTSHDHLPRIFELLLTLAGTRPVLRSFGRGLFSQGAVLCDTCTGSGSCFRDKDKCKKCKGKKTTSEQKILEIYIPRGSK